MKKWNLIVDVALCENCRNCTLAANADQFRFGDFGLECFVGQSARILT